MISHRARLAVQRCFAARGKSQLFRLIGFFEFSYFGLVASVLGARCRALGANIQALPRSLDFHHPWPVRHSVSWRPLGTWSRLPSTSHAPFLRQLCRTQSPVPGLGLSTY